MFKQQLAKIDNSSLMLKLSIQFATLAYVSNELLTVSEKNVNARPI